MPSLPDVDPLLPDVDPLLPDVHSMSEDSSPLDDHMASSWLSKTPSSAGGWDCKSPSFTSPITTHCTRWTSISSMILVGKIMEFL